MDNNINEVYKSINKTVDSYSVTINETLEKISKMGQVLYERLEQIKLPELKFSPDLILNMNYIMIMHKLKYPLFLESDKNFKRDIVKYKDDAVNIEKVIYEYANEDYLNNLFEQWETSSCIKVERLPIFREAIDLHIKGYYYACTTMMMCQLYGVVIDIYNHIEKNDIEISEESKKELAKEYEIEKIDSEKGKLIQLAFIPDGGHIIKEAIVEYFKKEVLSSSESKKRWEHQPLRNKICHGEQLNYGTKEHSLKAILCINLLVKLGKSIMTAIESIQENTETE